MTRFEYKPRAKNAAMLDRAWEMIQTVPYQVTTRWLFYQLLQEAWYSSKADYKDKFGPALSTARKRFYKDWRPDTLVDDTREPIVRGIGYQTVEDWLDGVQSRVNCQLDRWAGQEYYIELWFEARGMTRQFEYYTDHVTLRPMGGQPSIDYKWQSAKALERLSERYQAPIVILYFGDLDTGGEVISEVIERDVREWCAVNFEFVRCGLTADQVAEYKVPENFEKPGDYQWEALSDEAAEEIITSSMEPYLRHDALSTRDAEESQATEWLRGELAGLADKWEGSR